MTEVILIAGLPGCGKTRFLCEMCSDGWLVFDDFKANAFEDCSAFNKSRKFRALVCALRDNLKCVVADIDFCKEVPRQEATEVLRAEIPGLRLTWRYFENNPAACEANIKARNRGSLETDLKKLLEYSKSYVLPPSATVLPVFANRDPRR